MHVNSASGKYNRRIMEYGLQGAFIAQIASAEITPKSDFRL